MCNGIGEFCGCDIVGKAVNGAVANADAEGLGHCTQFQQGDARAVVRLFGAGRFDAVISNLPWGVKTGKNVNLEDLYQSFLHSAYVVTKPGGRVVVLILRGLLLLGVIRRMGYWRIIETRVVRTSNNLPTLFVLERLPADDMRDSLRQQLHKYSRHLDLPKAIFGMIVDDRQQQQQQQRENSEGDCETKPPRSR